MEESKKDKKVDYWPQNPLKELEEIFVDVRSSMTTDS